MRHSAGPNAFGGQEKLLPKALSDRPTIVFEVVNPTSPLSTATGVLWQTPEPQLVLLLKYVTPTVRRPTECRHTRVVRGFSRVAGFSTKVSPGLHE